MQAARGASLNSSAPSQPPTGCPRRRLLFFSIFVVAFTCDVVSKIVAVDRLDGRADVPVLGEILQLRLARNPGAAFSTAEGLTPVLSGLAIMGCVVVVYLARRVANRGWAVSLGLLLAGIGGNLSDRLFREPGVLHGHVIDFLMLPNWPIFNIADICINTGAGLALVMTFRGISIDGTRHDDESPVEEASA